MIVVRSTALLLTIVTARKTFHIFCYAIISAVACACHQSFVIIVLRFVFIFFQLSRFSIVFITGYSSPLLR